MAYRLAIFDFDGTLADTFPWFLTELNGVADRYRFKRTLPHEVERLRHLSARQLMAHLGVPRWKLPLITRHVRKLAARDIETIPLFEGVDRMLGRLAGAGIVIGIVSSNAEATIRRALKSEIASLVNHFACGASAFGKPTKLRRVLKMSGIPSHQAIAIGDEIRDHEAARKVGVAFGAVSWGFTHPAALSAHTPDALFGTPDDLAEQLVQRNEQATARRA